jgi:hypothetical protein
VVQSLPPSPLAVGGALVLALSASAAAVVPAPTAALVTSVAEAAGDSITDVPGILLPNASWPEAFLPLSDVIVGALLIENNLGQQQINSGNTELTVSRTIDLLGCRPKAGLARLGGAFFILSFDPTSPVGLVLDVVRPSVFDIGQGVSTACFPSDRVVVAFGDCTSPSSSSTSMVSMSALIMVVPLTLRTWSASPSSSSPPRPGSRPGRQESSPLSAACTVAQRPWMEPYETRREPQCHSPSLSRRHTCQWGELVTPARRPRRGPCNCAGPRRAAVLGTSRYPHGAKKQDAQTPSEPRRVLTETQIGKISWSKTHRVGGVVHP